MHTESVRGILDRDLRALIRELEAYPDDAAVWRDAPGVTNTAGTLALHVAGNLRHFVGAVLHGSGYVRDRDGEFARRDVPRAELLAGLEQARREVDAGLRALAPDRLDAPFPQPVGGVAVTTADLLVHLVSHLAYHVGQVDYHRRVVTEQNRTVGAVAPSELPSARPAG